MDFQRKMYRKSMPTTDAETLVHTLYLYLGYLNNKGIISNVILIVTRKPQGINACSPSPCGPNSQCIPIKEAGRSRERPSERGIMSNVTTCFSKRKIRRRNRDSGGGLLLLRGRLHRQSPQLHPRQRLRQRSRVPKEP